MQSLDHIDAIYLCQQTLCTAPCWFSSPTAHAVSGHTWQLAFFQLMKKIVIFFLVKLILSALHWCFHFGTHLGFFFILSEETLSCILGNGANGGSYCCLQLPNEDLQRRQSRLLLMFTGKDQAELKCQKTLIVLSFFTDIAVLPVKWVPLLPEGFAL